MAEEEVIEEVIVNPDMNATVNELQTQMTAVQAALAGTGQASLFKPRPFSGLPSEDINEWLMKFERFAKFYNWSNAKKLGAMTLLLDGPALAWFHTQTAETVANFQSLADALKARFGAQNLEFIFRQELYSRKQGRNEPLSVYTADVIKMCQRLGIGDKDMMNIFINGLTDEIKNHVILNQPDTFAKAENLARLRDAVTRNSSVRDSLTVARNISQENRIKELEGQVSLLVSMASQSKSQKVSVQPIQAIASGISADFSVNPNTFEYESLSPHASAIQKELSGFKKEMLAAIDAKFAREGQKPEKGKFSQQQRKGYSGARGRNLRTTDGQPICNNCQRVGHVARYCRSQVPLQQQQQPAAFFPQQQQQPQQPQSLPHNQGAYNQGNYSQGGYPQQNLNGAGPSQWGQ